MARVAAAWEGMTALFGYRLRVGATFGVLATLLNATLRGLIIMALSMPELAGQRPPENPFGAGGDWSLAAIGLASTAITFLETDPAVEWDGNRIAAVRTRPQLADPPGRRRRPAGRTSRRSPSDGTASPGRPRSS